MQKLAPVSFCHGKAGTDKRWCASAFNEGPSEYNHNCGSLAFPLGSGYLRSPDHMFPSGHYTQKYYPMRSFHNKHIYQNTHLFCWAQQVEPARARLGEDIGLDAAVCSPPARTKKRNIVPKGNLG